jgi:hypothetical protein
MARNRKRNRQYLSGIFTLAILVLLVLAFVAFKHHYFLIGFRYLAWADVPFTPLVLLTFPTMCRVETTKDKPCRNNAYGFLFGCGQQTAHRWGKFYAQLGFKNAAARLIQPNRPTRASAPSSHAQAQPEAVTVADGGVGRVCDVLTALGTVALVILTVTHV